MSQSRILIERVSSIDQRSVYRAVSTNRRECRQVTFQVVKERMSIAVKYVMYFKKKKKSDRQSFFASNSTLV